MSEPDFYINSSDNKAFEDPVRRAWRVKTLKGSDNREHVLLRVEPHLHIIDVSALPSDRVSSKEMKSAPRRDYEYILVSPRYPEESLFPVKAWPIHVNVAFPKSRDLRVAGEKRFVPERWYYALIATLYESEAHAKQLYDVPRPNTQAT